MLSLVDKIAQSHFQMRQHSCSASAHEFIMKLHDKIKPDDFPLQVDPSCERKGYEFETFLNECGFTGVDENGNTEGRRLGPEDAIKRIRWEVCRERYPLVAVATTFNSQLAAYPTHLIHIYVAARNIPTGDIGLFDPALKGFHTNSEAETLKLFERVLKSNGQQPHLLVYSELKE